MSKFVKVPAPIQLVDLVSGEPVKNGIVSLRDFVLTDVAEHPVWNVSLAETRALKDVVTAVSEVVSSELKIPEAAYGILKKCLEQPEYRVTNLAAQQEVTMRGYRRWAGAGLIQILPLIEALLDAKDKTFVDSPENGVKKKEKPAKEIETLT